MYKLALFDLDGTLMDSKVGILNSMSYALDYFGVKADPDAITRFIGPPIRDSFKVLYGFDSDKTEMAVAKYREYFEKQGMFEAEVYPEIVDLLKNLENHGIKMAVATSKVGKYAEQILRHFNISRYFDTIVGSEMDGTRSCKAEIISCVLDGPNIGRSAKAVMIGDREHDIIGAKAHKIDSIGVLWGYGGRAELEAAGATVIAHSPSELSHIISGV
jgi:phosphoglycolate phosphatase